MISIRMRYQHGTWTVNGMEFKSVAITGHTQGIGKGLYDYFVSKGCQVKGFSKTNGYDISYNQDLSEIIDETLDCDLFINNAYYKDQQVHLALQWHMSHKDNPHYLLNISSLGSDQNVVHKLGITNKQVVDYGLNKQLLNNVGNTINLSESVARCITVMPGIVDTNFIQQFPFDQGMADFYQRLVNKNTVLTVNDVVDSIVKVLDSITDKHFISSYTLLNG